MRRALILFLLTVVFAPGAAMAHSNAVQVDPKDGATLETLPAEATVTFNEPPKTADMVLSSPDGEVHVLKTRVDGSAVIATLPSNGPRGTYGLSYRVVSADGHPVAGTTAFVVTAGPEPAATQATSPPADDAQGRAGDSFTVIAALAAAAAAVGLISFAAIRARR